MSGIGINFNLSNIVHSGLLQETFDKATGYDNSGWSEELGANDTIIEDSTAVARPVAGGSQCLEIKAVTPDFTSSTAYTFSASQTKVYVSAYIRVETATMASNAVEDLLVLNGGGSNPIIISVWKAPDDSDRIHFVSRVYFNSSYNDTVYPAYDTAITTGVWYRFYLMYDIDNHLYEVKVQPDEGSVTTMVSGTLNGTCSTSITGITLGSVFSNTFTVYYDNIYIDKFGYPVMVQYCSAYQAVYDAMTTKPSGSVAFAQNIMINQLVATDVWTKLDWFWVAATETNDNGEALINWKNPGTNNPTNPTSTAWTALEGFTGDNSSDYIDTNFNPSSGTPNFSQNSACIGCYVRNQYNENKPAMSCSTTCSIFPSSSNSIYGRVNSTTSATWGVSGDSTGLTVICRTSNTNLTAYRDGSSLGNVNNSSTAPSNADFEILSMSALPYYGRYQVAIAFMGGVLDATENSNLYNAINVYMTRLGKNV